MDISCYFDNYYTLKIKKKTAPKSRTLLILADSVLYKKYHRVKLHIKRCKIFISRKNTLSLRLYFFINVSQIELKSILIYLYPKNSFITTEVKR